MYAFPGRLTRKLLETIARRDQIVKYVDLPLQHANREVLARMGRPRHDLRAVVAEIREAVPDVAIRSAFIVGFPGETDAEFAELLSFLEDARLDRVGVFRYSREVGTRAGEMPGQVPERVKERRFRKAMAAQNRISLERNRGLVGRTLDVLIEGRVEAEGRSAAEVPFGAVGRSYRDAPEVDGLVFVKGEAAEGAIVRARVVEAMEYDLVGELVGAAPSR
jgi:ribosomal protein S12 methylthiotransferase